MFSAFGVEAFGERAARELRATGGTAPSATSRPGMSSPGRRPRSPGSHVMASRTPRSARGCSSAPAPWSTTCTRSSASSTSAHATNCTGPSRVPPNPIGLGTRTRDPQTRRRPRAATFSAYTANSRGDSVHLNAQMAADATEAAGAQGAFWAMHDELLASQDELTPRDPEAPRGGARPRRRALLGGAASPGARGAGGGGRGERRHEWGRRHAQAFINGQRHQGAYDVDTLGAAVRAAQARARFKEKADPSAA